MGRIETGEEMDYSYVASALSVGIDLWNHALTALTTSLDHGGEQFQERVLKELNDDFPEAESESEIKKALENITARLRSLKKVKLTSKDGPFVMLSCKPIFFYRENRRIDS